MLVPPHEFFFTQYTIVGRFSFREPLIESPVFHVSCIEEFSHEVDKPSVVNVLAEGAQEQFMVEFIETG